MQKISSKGLICIYTCGNYIGIDGKKPLQNEAT